MDLRVTITDENGTELGSIMVYQDGSDAEGTLRILQYIRENFTEDIITNTEYDRATIIRKDPVTGAIIYPRPPKMSTEEWYRVIHRMDESGALDHDVSMENDDDYTPGGAG
jgi:hypothetical protein